MTIYGYARVSTEGQTLAGQEAQLAEAGAAKVFSEKISGASNQFGFLLAVKNPSNPRLAFSSRCAGLLPFRISASSCSRSSPLSRTTYFFTEISLAAMIASVARVATESNHKTHLRSN